jgi:hypothetical protein
VRIYSKKRTVYEFLTDDCRLTNLGVKGHVCHIGEVAQHSNKNNKIIICKAMRPENGNKSNRAGVAGSKRRAGYRPATSGVAAGKLRYLT